jgi:hypothetical protein
MAVYSLILQHAYTDAAVPNHDYPCIVLRSCKRLPSMQTKITAPEIVEAGQPVFWDAAIQRVLFRS